MNKIFFKEKKFATLEEELDYIEKHEAEYFMMNEEIGSILDEIDVDIDGRVFIWPDGSKLTMLESAKRIHDMTGIAYSHINSNMISWLEICYVPDGLDKDQMEIFEKKTDEWIDDFIKEISSSDIMRCLNSLHQH